MTPTANNQAVEAADLPETVAQALKKAFSLGQTYWQQADEQADGVAGYHLETPRTFSQLLPAT